MSYDVLPDDVSGLSPDQLVDVFFSSKLPLKTFCRRYGLSPSTFRGRRNRRLHGLSAQGSQGRPRRLTLAQESLLLEMASSEPFDSARQLAQAWQQAHQPEQPLLTASRLRHIFVSHMLELPEFLHPKQVSPATSSFTLNICRTLRYDYVCQPDLTLEQREVRREHRRQTRYASKDRASAYVDSSRHYPSDLSDAQWDRISELMQRPFPTGRPPSRPRDTLNAIFYILHTGAPWRYLPQAHYPPWNSVARALQRYEESGVWETLNRLLVEDYERDHPCAWPKVGIADSQSVETSEKGGPAVMTATKSEKEESVTLS